MKRFLRIAAVMAGVLLGAMFVPEMSHAVCISGYVRDAGGAAVAGADLDVVDVVTGVKLITPNDNTDAAGFYNICVLPGVYYLFADAARGSHLLGTVVRVDVSNNQSVAVDLTLLAGLVISGKVTNALGTAQSGVNIDVDSVGGGRVRTPFDTTYADGTYWLVVPAGTFRLRYDARPGTRMRGVQFDAVLISSDTVIDVVLPDGFLITGSVVNSLQTGIDGVAIDIRDQLTGQKVYASNDKTSGGGLFSIAVPSGLFQARFVPPAGSRYVAQIRDSVSVVGDIALNQLLPEGVLVTAIAVDSAGMPIKGVDLDVKLSSTGMKLFTPNDVSDALGRVVTALLPNFYTIQFQPPTSLPFGEAVAHNVPIISDTVITLVLPNTPKILLSGTVHRRTGEAVPNASIDVRSIVTGQRASVFGNLTDTFGSFSFAAPTGAYQLEVSPPTNTRLVGRRIDNLVLSVDTILLDILMDTGVVASVTVVDKSGFPVFNVDLDFFQDVTTFELFTPYDNTDSSGKARVVVPAGRYRIVATPPIWSVLPVAEVSGSDIIGDTDILIVLNSNTGGGEPSDILVPQNYPNPFNVGTTITYIVIQPTHVSVEVFNVLGQRVTILADGYHESGVYTTRWEGDTGGNSAASGVYVLHTQTPKSSVNTKMLLIR
jgi:hypothetical protein